MWNRQTGGQQTSAWLSALRHCTRTGAVSQSYHCLPCNLSMCMGRNTTVYVASGGSAKQSARQTQQSNVKHIIDKKKEKKYGSNV